MRDSGTENHIILSSRVRLARNLLKYSFVNNATEEERENIIREVLDVRSHCTLLKNMNYFSLCTMDDLDIRFLMERRLISREFAESVHARGFLTTENESIQMMINEEDHIRIQSVTSGYHLAGPLERVHALDRCLEEELTYAVSDRYGYLTACPSNTGSGARFSVLMHLPGLVLSGRLETAVHGLMQSGVAIRGLYGERSGGTGNMFQVSNQYTLGSTEAGIMEEMTEMISQLMNMEEASRENLLKKQRNGLEETIHHAVGILTHTREIGFQECLNLLSLLRLGSELNILNHISSHVLNELMIVSQPVHLQKMEGKTGEFPESDVLRAEMIRQKLNLN